MTRLRPALALTATMLAAMLSAAGPASAETGSVNDAAGDAPAHGDVLELSARNGTKKVHLVVALEELKRRKTSVYAIVDPRGGRQRSYAVGWTQSDELDGRRVFARIKGTSIEPITCRGLEIDIDTATDELSASVPQRCLGKPSELLRITALTENRSSRDLDTSPTLRLARG